MNNQFTQPNKIVAVETNKQAIARVFNIKQNQVGYLAVGQPLTGYLVLYDRSTQTCWSTGNAAGSVVSWSILDNVLTLVTAQGTYTLIRVMSFNTWSTIPAGNIEYSSVPTGGVARTQADKNKDLVSVKDFGAKGDGIADDTLAIQAAITSLSPQGGRLYLPKGSYVISSELKVNNMPIEIFGDGIYVTTIEQITTNANGIKFVSDTDNNAPVTNNLLINLLHIHDLSINRGLGSGGAPVVASWKIMTSNSPQAIFERFRTYSKSDAGRTWAGALDLRNCNGLRMNTVQLHGNPLESSSDVADPYTMRYGIRLSNDSNNALGLISFFIDKLTIIAAGVGIDVYGWHEGFEIVNSEIVQVGTGIKVVGDAVHQNPDFFYLNSHIEARVNCVVMSNVFKVKFIGCDLFQSSLKGYAGAIVQLNGCQSANFAGTSFSMQRGSNGTNYTVGGIVCDTSYHGNVTGCTFMGLDAGIDVLKDNWMIGDNVFYQVTNPIRLYGNNHTVGVNRYTECANKNTYVGTGQQITPISFTGSQVLTVANPGAQQGLNIPIPAGIFKTAPDMVAITLIGGSSPIMIMGTYNFAASTAINIKIEVTGSQSIPAGSYTFGFYAIARP